MNAKPYVLYVDDEPNVLRSCKRALRNEAYEVLFAQSGAEALELLKNRSVQAVITDFRMAGMNGVELIQEIKKRDPRVVCAILSGYADEATVQQALRMGQINKFLLKPIDNEELKKEIRELLAQGGQ